jgi:hypothetical protein
VKRQSLTRSHAGSRIPLDLTLQREIECSPPERSGLPVLEDDRYGLTERLLHHPRTLHGLAGVDEIERIDDGNVTSWATDHQVLRSISSNEAIPAGAAPEAIHPRPSPEKIATGETEDPIIPSAPVQAVGFRSAANRFAAVRSDDPPSCGGAHRT